jgi:tRNA pseudouridine38-40 synthase
VQDHLEHAFQRVNNAVVRVHGAGRTDAGVHALAQCAHVDVSNKSVSADRWIKALNGLLPSAIRVLRCRYVSKDFHARLRAKGKIYRYTIWTAPILPPFEYRRAWHIARPFD